MKTITGVVVPVVLLAILVPAGFLFWRRRKQRQERRGTISQEKIVADTDEGSDYGFRVAVQGGHTKEVSTPSELYLGAPGALPIIPEERLSQCWTTELDVSKVRGGSAKSGGWTPDKRASSGGSRSGSDKISGKRSSILGIPGKFL
jgi:hypothetical protein